MCMFACVLSLEVRGEFVCVCVCACVCMCTACVHALTSVCVRCVYLCSCVSVLLSLKGPCRGSLGSPGPLSCSGAQVRDLRPCGKATLQKLKEAEESKEKTYQARLSATSSCGLRAIVYAKVCPARLRSCIRAVVQASGM